MHLMHVLWPLLTHGIRRNPTKSANGCSNTGEEDAR